MAPKRSIFFEDWRACLHAHYEYVVRAGDEITEPTLRHVLRQTGLSTDEMDQIREAILADAQSDGDAPYQATVVDEHPMVGEQFDYADDSPAYLEELLPDETFIEDVSVETLPEDFVEEEGIDSRPPDDIPPEDPSPSHPSQLSLF